MASAMTLMSGLTRTTRNALAIYPVVRGQFALLASFVVIRPLRGTRENIYNILWAVVFGFATLNILSLAARRLEPTRKGLSFGELMAVVVVLLSMVLLGMEMMKLFHIFPIKLKR
jgi:hypothetical protein